MQHLIEFLNQLVDDFSWRRVSLIISCLALIVITLIAYETYTSSFFLAKTEKTIQLIKELSSLPPEISKDSKGSLSDLTKTVVKQLQDSANTTFFHFELSPSLMKVVSTSVPWLITILIVLIIRRDDKTTLVMGFIVVWLISVVIGVLLPWQNIIWSNYWAYPVIDFLITIWGLAAYGNRGKTVQ